MTLEDLRDIIATNECVSVENEALRLENEGLRIQVAGLEHVIADLLARSVAHEPR